MKRMFVLAYISLFHLKPQNLILRIFLEIWDMSLFKEFFFLKGNVILLKILK